MMQAFTPRAKRSSVIRHLSFRHLSFAISLFLFSLSLYTLTLSPNLLPADSGEYQLVGAALGVAHPPGFALYTILSWLTTRWLIALSPATAINFLSALLAALTVTLVGRIVQRTTGSTLAGLGAALALAFSTTFWAQATTANVRILAAFAVTLALDRIIAYRHSLTPQPPNHALCSSRSLRLVSIAFALGLGVSHHASTIFITAVLGLYTLWLNPSIIRRPWPLLLGLAPFLAWLYFPLRAAAVGAPRLATLDGFLEHVLARGFSGDIFFFATLKDLPDRLLIFGNVLTFEFVWPLLILAGLGGVAALWRDRPLGLALLAAWLVHSFIAITYKAPQTVEYLLPAYVFMSVAIGFALAELERLILSLRFPFVHRPSSVVSRPSSVIRHSSFVITSLAFIVSQFNATYPSYRALAKDTSTRDYTASVLAAAPSNALILSAWHWVNPLWYLQRVERLRPDVEVRYVFPHGESLAQNWVDEINTEIGQRPVVVTSFYKPEYAALPYRFAPLGPAWEVRANPLTEPPASLVGAQSLGGWTFLGYTLEPQSVPFIQSVDLTAAWQTAGAPQDISFFVHLLGADGQLYGQIDISHPASRYLSGEVLLDRYHLEIRPDTPPGDYSLMAGAYLPDGTRLAEIPLTTLHLSPRTFPPVTLHPLFRPFGAATLIGYDVDYTLPASPRLYLHWKLGREAVTIPVLDAQLSLPAGPGYLTTAFDITPGQPILISDFQLRTSDFGLRTSNYAPLGNAVLLTGVEAPSTARPGDTITVAVHLMAARPLVEDYAVKIALEGAGWQVAAEGTAIGGAIPTFKWNAGSRLTDRRVLAIPADAAPGPAQLVLAMYEGLTQRDLASLDPRLAALGPTVPLGTVEIVSP